MSEENRRLTETLATFYDKYETLRRQLAEMKGASSPSLKRKTESFDSSSTEASSGEEDTLKKPREEETKMKISKAIVRTNPTDTTLVKQKP